LFETFRPFHLRESLCPAVMAHLPEMEAPRSGRRDSSYQVTPHPERGRSRVWALVPALVPLLRLVWGLAIAYSWPPLVPQSGRAIGKVTYLEGTAHRAYAGSTVRESANLKESVYEGQRFSTSSTAQMMLALAGPTYLKMDSSTRIKVQNERAISLESGAVWLHVGTDGRYFQVATPNGDVTVFGTQFEVRVDMDKTIVTVADGEVQVENDKAFTVLRADRQVEVSLGQSHLHANTVNAEEVLAWTRTIQADTDADKAFWAEINPVAGVIPAEQVFAVRTMGKAVSSIVLEWQEMGVGEGHCSYTVYVSDDKMEPIYRGVIDGAVFDSSTDRRFEFPIDSALVQNMDVIHIKVVPNMREGGRESSFTSVSAVSS